MDKIIQLIKTGDAPNESIIALSENGNIYGLNLHVGIPKWSLISKSPNFDRNKTVQSSAE